MPVLNISEDEKAILVTALTHERVLLITEWKKRAENYDSSAFSREADCAEIDEHADDIADLRRKIEVAADITKFAWHNEYGWLRSKKDGEIAKATVEAEADLIERDLHEFGESILVVSDDDDPYIFIVVKLA